MKKLLVVVGLLFGMSVVSRAGTPQEVTQNGAYSNSSIYGSLIVSASSSTLLAAPASKNGVPGRYCFNQAQLVAANTVLAYIIDGSTTPTSTNGIALSGLTTSTANTMTTPHLEPLCLTLGNAAGIYSTGASTFTYAGYVNYGGAGGSSANAGY